MAKKEKGKITDCWQCGEELVCVEIEYQGKKSLQWQNNDGTAHYKFISEGNYECKTLDFDNPPTLETKQPPVKTTTGSQKIETSRLQAKLTELLKSPSANPNGTVYNVMKMYIQTLEICDDMGITDEIKRGMMFNNVIRRSVKD